MEWSSRVQHGSWELLARKDTSLSNVQKNFILKCLWSTLFQSSWRISEQLANTIAQSIIPHLEEQPLSQKEISIWNQRTQTQANGFFQELASSSAMIDILTSYIYNFNCLWTQDIKEQGNSAKLDFPIQDKPLPMILPLILLRILLLLVGNPYKKMISYVSNVITINSQLIRISNKSNGIEKQLPKIKAYL